MVIGILIALQINNWNENRKEFNRSEALLGEIKKDLERNTAVFNYVAGVLNKQLALIELAQRKPVRNYIRENYIHRKEMLKYLGRTKEKGTDLILCINKSLEIEK